MRFAKVGYEMIKLKKYYKVREMKKISLVLLSLLSLTACNSGSSSSSGGGSTYPSNPTNTLPSGFECLPSSLPSLNSATNSVKIAYGGNCQVANVSNTSVRASLESMAVALTNASGGRYCTGTPLSYDPTTGVAYVLSAAHCVVGNSKAANQPITAGNIVTFSSNNNYINQTLNATNGSEPTGTITAVYVPSQYCQVPAFVYDSDSGSYLCGNLSAQNGDFALVKVNIGSGKSFALNSQVQLATSAIQPEYPSYIMALGYGKTNTNNFNTSLFYITYEYFATNSYQGNTGETVIMNGYSPYGSNAYYSIICGGDSGGGDFYWANNTWNLIGVHSYGSSTCGQASTSYTYVNLLTPGANDVSADVRPFASQLSNIMAADKAAGGCNSSAASSNNFVCADATSN